MKFNIKQSESYSLATIVQPKSDIVTSIITVDVHQERTVEDQAVELMYADAILSGAGKFSRDEFLNAVNLLGASIKINISDSTVNLTLKSTKQNFKKILKLVEVMFNSPTFEKSELIRIKSTVTNGQHEAKEDTKKISLASMRNVFYGYSDRKYSYDIEETISKIKTTTSKQLKTFHNLVLNQPWTCSIAGESSTVAEFEKFVKGLKSKQKNRFESKSLHQQKPPKSTVILNDVPSRSNIDFNIGAPIPITLHHPDYVPLSFAITILAKWGGFSGILMSTVREKEGLTYTIYGRPEGFTGTEQGYWRIFTFFSPDKTLQGITSTFREISNFYKNGVTEEQLNKFKIIINTQQELIKDSITSILYDLHAYHSQHFTLEEMLEHKKRVSNLTLKEVNHAIKTYLNPNTLTISGAGPIKTIKNDLEKVAKTLR